VQRFRFNYGELEDCTMLLDIGAKTSNLLFSKRARFSPAALTWAQDAITQDFANDKS